MKLNRATKIGIFLVIIVIASFALLNFLKGQDIFKHTRTYYAVYDNVEGLTPSSPVFLQGLKIGTIEKITFEAEYLKFIIKIGINENYHIPRNSTAQIFNTNFMGSKAMRIVFGDSNYFLHKGDTIKTQREPEITAIISNELVPLKQKIDTLVTTLNVTARALNAVLNTETQAHLTAGIAALRNTMDNLQQFTKTLEQEKGNIKNIIKTTNEFMSELQTGGSDLTRTLNNLASITDSLQAADIKATITHLNTLLLQANNPEGSVGKLLHDDNLYNNVSRAVDHLDSLISAIQSNPKKYIKITVF
jgi:phospholipid/cholesterol/gamma-HCH transport system substrate-binding protein